MVNLRATYDVRKKWEALFFLWDYPFWFQSCVHRHVQNGDLTDGKLKQMRTRKQKNKHAHRVKTGEHG